MKSTFPFVWFQTFTFRKPEAFLFQICFTAKTNFDSMNFQVIDTFVSPFSFYLLTLLFNQNFIFNFWKIKTNQITLTKEGYEKSHKLLQNAKIRIPISQINLVTHSGYFFPKPIVRKQKEKSSN